MREESRIAPMPEAMPTDSKGLFCTKESVIANVFGLRNLIGPTIESGTLLILWENICILAFIQKIIHFI